MIAPERPGQHRDIAGSEAPQARKQPRPGIISIEPSQPADFVDAVDAGGATVEPVSDRTAGLVWLSEKRAPELAAILKEAGKVLVEELIVFTHHPQLADLQSYGRELWDPLLDTESVRAKCSKSTRSTP